MTIKKIIPLLLLAFTISVSAQLDKSSKATFLEADFNYLIEDYQKAMALYENLLSVDPDNCNLNFLCGNCCLKIYGTGNSAINYLKKAVLGVSPSYKNSSYKERNAPTEAYLQLARAYHMNGDFDEAIHTYEIYRDSTDLKRLSEIEFINRQIKSCEFAKQMIASPMKVEFQMVLKDAGQVYSRTNPVISGNDSMMIFVVDNPLNKSIMMITRQGDDWSKPYKINGQLGVTGNFSTVSLSYDGTELYLVQQDYYNSDIYVSRYANSGWSKVEKLNKHVNSRYYETHASVSRDGKSLFFTSDRKGGYGGLDIYQSDMDQAGNWGEAVNLGPLINTIYNEESPFITKHDSKLYFSSEGHQNMGGYDIFSAEKDSEGDWSSPENIGYPINTTSDDLFYNPGWDDRYGLYAWGIQERAMKNIKIINILPTEEMLTMMPVDTLTKVANDMETKGEPLGNNLEVDPGLSKTGAYITLNNILFEFNDYSLSKEAIREVDRIYEVMQESKEITVELTGHTDSRGSAQANLRLSTQRAQSVANYLIDKGITADRITVRGLGESSPVAINEFPDGSDASQGRLFNRYTSIKFSNLSDEKVQVAEMMVPENLKPVQDQSYVVVLTENEQVIKKMPEEFFGRSVALVKTENTNFYIADKFESKAAAVTYLNEAIDYGFPEARILESGELVQFLGGRNQEENSSNYKYTIQIMALRKSRDVSYFSDLGLVMKYTGEDGIHRYTYGKYDSKNEAERELSQVLQQGYRDAFVISSSRFGKTSVSEGPSAVLSYTQ